MTTRRNVVLIGARGCGKTTVGRELARRLGRPFVDTDERIVARAGRTIHDIFAEDGEPAFRQLESTVIAELTRSEALVLSVGGGAVVSAGNRERLGAMGACIWLTAPVEELWRRIAADETTLSNRPPLTVHTGLDEIRHLLAQREPLYAAIAEHVVSTAGRSVGQVVAAVLAALPPDMAAAKEL